MVCITGSPAYYGVVRLLPVSRNVGLFGPLPLSGFNCSRFNALSGTGGGGQVTATIADNSNTALYSTFSVVGFFAGSLVNRLGIKLTLSFGGFGYFIYVASFLSYNFNQNAGFNIFAGW